jgi:hypothetical protein
VHTVDYRHCYYQFLIPQRLAWYFFIVVDGVKWLPRVLSMDFREAVTIAQCATWALVLYREDKEDALGVDALGTLPAMPAYVSLARDGREVGRIFELLDGVCVACADEELREAWCVRLRRQEDRFHVVRKETKEANLRSPNAEIEFVGSCSRPPVEPSSRDPGTDPIHGTAVGTRTRQSTRSS